MGLLLSGEDIRALENRTEGWIAGLQLAGLSLRGRDDPSSFIANLSGSHRYILGYLTEEVLSRQTEEIQDFLLQTSILDKLSGDLCGAVTGRSDSNMLLERLCTANLFLIPLDDEQRWYRYHHLFGDLLRSQRGRLPKELVTQLHTRASQWYEDNGMVVEGSGARPVGRRLSALRATARTTRLALDHPGICKSRRKLDAGHTPGMARTKPQGKPGFCLDVPAARELCQSRSVPEPGRPGNFTRRNHE